jgi:hypothetical protein
MYVTEIGSGAMIYMPSLVKTGSDIQMLMGRYTRIDSNVTPTFIFS